MNEPLSTVALSLIIPHESLQDQVYPSEHFFKDLL
jgi:hypothetical protein